MRRRRPSRFWAVGIDGAIFWGTVMTVLSIIPGVGGALVWVPAAIILMTTGEVWRGIALALFCALVVGSVDNVLRPRLVGQDTKMHELLIFFSTLGGLMFFGAMGFILGPDPGGPLRHRVGNVRHGVPQRARRTGIRGSRPRLSFARLSSARTLTCCGSSSRGISRLSECVFKNISHAAQQVRWWPGVS